MSIVFLGALCAGCRSAPPGDAVSGGGGARITAQLGEPRVLIPNKGLGLKYFPDEAIAIVQREPQLRLLLTAGVSSWLVQGADIENLRMARQVLTPGPKGSFDGGYAGISGAYLHTDGKLYAIYHAEDQEGMPGLPGDIPGFYCSLALAVSPDLGETWAKLGPIVTSNMGKEWVAYTGQADRGVGEPGIVVEKGGSHLLAYYTDHSRQDGRGVQICLARAPISRGAPGPGAWRKYFDGGFSEPGLGGRETPVLSARHLDGADAIQAHPVYSDALRKYVMVFNVNCWKEYMFDDKPKYSGIYVAYSDDGIRWSAPEPLIIDYAVPVVGRSVSWQASLVWDPDSTLAGWLIYSHSDKWGHEEAGTGTPHYMVGRRIRFGMKPNGS